MRWERGDMKESQSLRKYRTRIGVGMRVWIGIEIDIMEERDTHTLHHTQYNTAPAHSPA
jgi:hypothetical protein